MKSLKQVWSSMVNARLLKFLILIGVEDPVLVIVIGDSSLKFSFFIYNYIVINQYCPINSCKIINPRDQPLRNLNQLGQNSGSSMCSVVLSVGFTST